MPCAAIGTPGDSAGAPLARTRAACYVLAMYDCLDLALDGLAHDGRGIGHLKDASRGRGLTVFVAGGLPGQLVRSRVRAQKPRFIEAELVEVLRPAGDEVSALCPHAGAASGAPGRGCQGCGGCPLQTMPYVRQLEWKERLARDALTRIGGLDEKTLDAAWEGVLPSPATLGFRNRMTFAFGPGADGLVLGQRNRGGADVVPTPDCALLPPGGREILACAQEVAAQSGLPAWRASALRGARNAGGFWRFLTLRQGRLAGEAEPRWWVVCLTSPGGPAGSRGERAAVRALGERLLALGGASRLGGFIHEERRRDDALAVGERRVLSLDAQGAENPDAAILHLPLAGRTFALDAASFFQVNTGAAELLARTVTNMAQASGGRGLLDVYCGVGAPVQLIDPGYTTILGMESDRRAVALARRNAAEAGLTGCEYLAGDAGQLLTRLVDGAPLPGPAKDRKFPQWDTALLDPPRGGLAPEALDALLRLAPEHVLYVSCNPATLSRDAARLSTAYSLERLKAVDLFPHTPHLECCSLWRRRRLPADATSPQISS